GLLFADKEEEPGRRISDVRFKQLQATGAATVVTACPFCSIMLKGAKPSARADTQFSALMSDVDGKLEPHASPAATGGSRLRHAGRRGWLRGLAIRWLPRSDRHTAGATKARNTINASSMAAAGRSWRSGMAASCLRPCTSAAAASW